jgi:hypothetical protein
MGNDTKHEVFGSAHIRDGVQGAVCLCVGLLVLTISSVAQTRTFKVLHVFTGSPDGNGNLYGTTYAGRDPNCTLSKKSGGIIFKVNSAPQQ